MKTSLSDFPQIACEFAIRVLAAGLNLIASSIIFIISFFKGKGMPEPKKVLITGPTSGLGRGLAKEYCKTATDLYLIGRSQEKLDELKTELNTINSNCAVHLYCCDIASEEFTSVLESISSTEDIDLVIANAGVKRVSDDSGSDLYKYSNECIDTNVKGAVNTVQYFIEPMKKRGSGQLLIVQGAIGNGIYGGDALYEASKNFIRAYGLDLRRALLQYNIHVNLLNPGFIRSNMTKGKKKMFMCYEPEDLARYTHQQLLCDIPQINTPLPTYLLTTFAGSLSGFGFSLLPMAKTSNRKPKSA